ncbi:MAG: hypothetical protein IT357_11870, partial [Gemmatimonadaceae bacterium]|nr:hypothetical protein [Gemmatimonadaceae bacterium]
MTSFVLYDDAIARGFEPFALTRPAGELRAGGELTRRRWAQVLGVPAQGFIAAPHLVSFEEFDAPTAQIGPVDAGAWVVNARALPTLSSRVPAGASRVMIDGEVAAVRVASSVALGRFADGTLSLDALAEVSAPGTTVDAEGWWLRAVWDLIGHVLPMLASDAVAMAPAGATRPAHLTVVGTGAVFVDPTATIEPLVVADTASGPVLIRRGATVQAFTRLVGPCVVGEDAVVSGGRVAACSIGERVKVNGEISTSILIGHCNKGHDGFVGHSVIGRWANLGADTVTSNLKNSYGSVALWTPSGVRETGLQFLGALIGDHAKTGIGTRLTTGCVVGAGANVFGSVMPPKAVAPFAWGEAPAWET